MAENIAYDTWGTGLENKKQNLIKTVKFKIPKSKLRKKKLK